MLLRLCVAHPLAQTDPANLDKWDSVDRSTIQERKIRVVWLPPSPDGHLDVAATPVRQHLSNGVSTFSSIGEIRALSRLSRGAC